MSKVDLIIGIDPIIGECITAETTPQLITKHEHIPNTIYLLLSFPYLNEVICFFKFWLISKINLCH